MKIDYEFACQDNCLDKMVPSDLRQLVCERDQAYRNIDVLKAEFDALREQIRWRDVREELPNDSQKGDFLVFVKNSKTSWCAIFSFNKEGWDYNGVTHWMPLPSHPTTTS